LWLLIYPKLLGKVLLAFNSKSTLIALCRIPYMLICPTAVLYFYAANPDVLDASPPRALGFTGVCIFLQTSFVPSKNFSAPLESLIQGDQIGRIFAYWATLFFGQFF
jgi:hypothetical protein